MVTTVQHNPGTADWKRDAPARYVEEGQDTAQHSHSPLAQGPPQSISCFLQLRASPLSGVFTELKQTELRKSPTLDSKELTLQLSPYPCRGEAAPSVPRALPGNQALPRNCRPIKNHLISINSGTLERGLLRITKDGWARGRWLVDKVLVFRTRDLS